MTQNTAKKPPVALGRQSTEGHELSWRDSQGRAEWTVQEGNGKVTYLPVVTARNPRAILERHRIACGEPSKGPMFANGKGNPANLNNTLNREILPALNHCEVCRKSKAEHAGVSHEFKRDDTLPMWHGWHAFRRGLATTLYDLGVDDLMVQQILRHGDVVVTREHYIKTTSKQSIAAMSKLESAFGSLCADRALTAVPAKNSLPN